MRVLWIAVALTGCGRIGFDGLSGGAELGDVAAPDALPSGLRLWLRMEDSPSDGAFDSAMGHASACDSGCPIDGVGRVGRGYHFNQSGFVRVAFAADFDTGAEFTVAAWMLINTYPIGSDFLCAIGKPFGTMSSDSYALCVDSSMRSVFYSADPAGVDDYIQSSGFPLGQFRHLAMSWDGTTKRGYVDGVEIGSRAIDIGQGPTDIFVGADENFSTSVYKHDGALDEVMVFDRALAASDIASLANP